MAVELGINPITWTNDDMPELGGDIPLETCLAETREAGYSGTELGGKFPRVSSELAPILARHRLKLVSGWYDGRMFERDVSRGIRCDRTASDVAARPGLQGRGVCRYVAPREATVPADIAAASNWPMVTGRDYGRKVTDARRTHGRVRRRMAFHHHMGTIVQTDAEIDRLMANYRRGSRPAVRLPAIACSPAAIRLRCCNGTSPASCTCIARTLRRAVLDRVLAEDMSFMAAVQRGCFHRSRRWLHRLHAVAAAAAEAGYAGWLVVEAEQDPRKAHPLTYARLGHSNLRAMAQEAGFEVT